MPRRRYTASANASQNTTPLASPRNSPKSFSRNAPGRATVGSPASSSALAAQVVPSHVSKTTVPGPAPLHIAQHTTNVHFSSTTSASSRSNVNSAPNTPNPAPLAVPSTKAALGIAHSNPAAPALTQTHKPTNPHVVPHLAQQQLNQPQTVPAQPASTAPYGPQTVPTSTPNDASMTDVTNRSSVPGTPTSVGVNQHVASVAADSTSATWSPSADLNANVSTHKSTAVNRSSKNASGADSSAYMSMSTVASAASEQQLTGTERAAQPVSTVAMTHLVSTQQHAHGHARSVSTVIATSCRDLPASSTAMSAASADQRGQSYGSRASVVATGGSAMFFEDAESNHQHTGTLLLSLSCIKFFKETSAVT